MGRGRGKGKRGGRGGQGRQHFVSSLEELESRNDRDEAWAARRKAEREADGSDDGEEGDDCSISGGNRSERFDVTTLKLPLPLDQDGWVSSVWIMLRSRVVFNCLLLQAARGAALLLLVCFWVR